MDSPQAFLKQAAELGLTTTAGALNTQGLAQGGSVAARHAIADKMTYAEAATDEAQRGLTRQAHTSA